MHWLQFDIKRQDSLPLDPETKLKIKTLSVFCLFNKQQAACSHGAQAQDAFLVLLLNNKNNTNNTNVLND